jgi:UDP-N-acetylmuramate dehydrogenase
MTVTANQPLKSYNTFGIDAQAAWLAHCTEVSQMQQILSDKNFNQVPLLVLGGGSNILFTRDWDGLVLRNELKGITITSEDDEYVYVKAMAGEAWHPFVQWCIARGLAGLENLSLIPGNVGASPMQNIGAYGVEIKDLFHELEALHIVDRSITNFTAADCKFGYRESVFKRELKNQFIITSVTYRLSKQPTFNTSYGAIEQELERMGVQELTTNTISQAVINIRSSKLPDPKQIGNAGSFFKNPEVPVTQFQILQSAYPKVSAYPLANGNYKLAAGWLIEQCGWKGFRSGDAGVHDKQALVLVNHGLATGNEIYELSSEIISSVQQKFGVVLEREVNII